MLKFNFQMLVDILELELMANMSQLEQGYVSLVQWIQMSFQGTVYSPLVYMIPSDE